MGHTPNRALHRFTWAQICRLQRGAHSARVVPDPSCGGTSPNSPRAGRQQGQVSSSRYAGGPPMCPSASLLRAARLAAV